MLTRTLQWFALILSFVVCSVFIHAQDPGEVLGQPPLQKYINVGGGLDEINTGDLTVHVSIPLNNKGPYGPVANASLSMDSRTYMYNYNTGSGNQIFSGSGLGFVTSARANTQFSFSPNGNLGTCAPPLPSLAGYGAYDGNGTFHLAATAIDGCGLSPLVTGADGWSLGVGLGYSVYGWNFGSEEVSPSGITTEANFLNNGAPCPSYSTFDLHSNTISDNLCWSYNSSGVMNQASGSVTDAAGNEGITASLSGNNVVLLQFPGPNGTTSTYQITYYTYTVNQDFGCPGLTVPAAQTVPLPLSIQFPDGSAASFSYELNSLHTGTITGRIAQIQIPASGVYQYTYTGGTHGVNCSDGTTSGITKQTPDGWSWTLTHTAYSGTANISTTKVVAPSGDYIVDTISTVPPSSTAYVIPQMSTVASLSYNSGNSLLASTYACYNGYHPTSPLSCASPTSAPSFPISEIDLWNYVPGVGSPSLKVTLLDGYSRVTDVKSYNFGGVVGGTNYDTDVQNAYGSWNGSSCANIPNTNGYGTYNLLDRVCYKKMVVSGGTVASYFTYGMSGNSFGELVTRQDTIGGVLVTTDSRTYDSLGRVLTSVGPNGETTTSAYTQCSGQELSSVSVKTSSSGGTLGSSYSGYDCVGEKATIKTDSNGHNSSVNFGSDPLWRPVSATDAAGIVTNYTYAHGEDESYGPTIDVQTTIVSGSSSAETKTRFDTSGRVDLTEVRQGPSSNQYTITETDYDSDGRPYRVTLPYSGEDKEFNSTIAATITTYDGLGRVQTVAGPAYSGTTPGSTLTYTYSANDVLVVQSPAPSGEHTKSRQTETNGLGEITSVCEVSSMPGSSSCGQATAASGFLTTYTYYPGGKLQSATQNAVGSQTQIRSFTYDNINTGRPLTVTTPESGTSTTTYDSDPAHTCASFTEFPVKTVDNAGGISCFQYDLADRLTSVSFSGFNGAVTPTKTFVYDASSNPAFTCTAVNGAGQIVEASTSLAGTLLTDEGLCYDPDGRPTDSFLWTSTGKNAYGHITEQYFANGVPQTISWIGGWPSPTPPTVTYTLDPMGRVYSASDSNSNTLVTSASYYLDNSVNTVVFGNGDQSAYTEYANFTPNVVTHTIGTATNNTIAYTPVWNSNGTLQSLQTVDKFAAANSQTCTFSYDDLIRISTDNCGSAWSESFVYDPFGNVTKAGSLTWPPPGVTYAGSNNRYYEASGNPFSYDANGRLLADTFDALSWDVNGNMLSQTGTAFSYDAVDRPVGSTSAGTTTSYVYAPDGSMVATLENTTTPVWKVFVDLPASRVVYDKQAGLLSPFYIERDDWQGSVRVSSVWTTRGRHSDVAYDAFGVPYWSSGTSDNQFSGLNTDVFSGTELVSESRRYHPSQGRWESPDDGVPDLYNPQSFNAYHYSLNMPTTVTDPDGQDEIDGDGGTPCPMCNLIFDPAYSYEIDQEYFASIGSLAALYQSSGIGGALYPQAIAQQMAQNDINIVANQSGGLAAGAMSLLSDEFGGMAKQAANTIPDMANSINRPLDAFLSNFTSFRFGEVPALQPSTKGQEAAMFGTSVGLLFIPGAGEEELVVGASGRFSSLSKLRVIGDFVENHHMPQKGLGFTSPAEGGALAMTHAEHAMTRTYAAKGAATARAEAGMAFRTVLARDIRDVRGIVGTKYNQGMLKLLQYYRESFPGLMAK